LKQKSTEVSSSTGFLNYFRGLSLSVDANDTAAVYGLTAGSTMAMRVFYHHTTPVVEQKSIDFPMLSNTYSFNQIVADRTATPLATVAAGTREVSADYTSGFSFSQNGAGLFLKMTFPSLKGILKTDKTVKLTHAELLIRPARLSFDGTRFKLPASMYMQLTDGSNITGEYVLDSTGTQRQYSDPVIDGIYGENTYYRFNVTSYINQLLTNGGTEDDGFFLMGQSTSSSMDLNRLVVEDAAQPAYRVSLRLSLLIVD
jgi:hypothetical protein